MFCVSMTLWWEKGNKQDADKSHYLVKPEELKQSERDLIQTYFSGRFNLIEVGNETESTV